MHTFLGQIAQFVFEYLDAPVAGFHFKVGGLGFDFKGLGFCLLRARLSVQDLRFQVAGVCCSSRSLLVRKE